MRPVVVQAPASTGVSAPVIIDYHLDPMNIGLSVVLSNTPSLTTKVQYSLDDPYATYATDYNTNATWYDVTGMTGLVANTAGTPTIPCRAFRLNNTIYSTGTATLTVVQSGGIS